MDENPKKTPPDDPFLPDTDEFNRTVVVERPSRKQSSHSTPLHKLTSRFARKKQEVEDIIGGANLSHYTSEDPDTTAVLPAPLSNLETRYSVLEELAKGGHATVSVARDRNLRRIVAIKSLRDEAKKSGDTVDAFVSEAKVTAQLDHPGIIPIYGLTCDGKNDVHLSMKLVNGKTLRDYLRNLALNYRIKGIKSFDEAALLRKRLEIFLRVCDAIDYAHHRNIMHRDLKPENIMLGEFMEVYVMDWGLARVIPKATDTDTSNSEKVTGTPRYFPPEALLGKRCDERSDLFTLGLILQEIVTLQFAVKGKTEKEFMDRIMNGELEPVEHLFHWRIDKPLKAIIKKATAYRPSDRYQSVAELADDLRRYMGGLSVTACPDTFFSKLTRQSYRYRKEFLVGLMAILFGSAAITAYAIYSQLQTIREMTLQRRAMNYTYNRMGTVSNHLNVTALYIQEQLSAMARISAYLLSYNTATGKEDWKRYFRPSMSKIGKTEVGMFYSPYYKRMISLDYGIYTFAPDADPVKCTQFIEQIYPVLTKMKNLVLGSTSGFTFDKKDYEKLKTMYLYQGLPIRAVYIGSIEGVKLLYPWRGNYPREIDPRKRSWYQDAYKKNGPFWSQPYMDAESISGLSMPCSVPIYDLQGKFRGVVGADVSVNKLTNSIIEKGNTGNYVLEKAVITLNGEVVFSTKSHFFNKKFDPEKLHEHAVYKAQRFGTPEVRYRILKRNRDFGTFIIPENGKKRIYSFAHLTIFNMYFVVVCDYDRLIQYLETTQEPPSANVLEQQVTGPGKPKQ